MIAVAVAISSRFSAIPKKDFARQLYFTLSYLAARSQGTILVCSSFTIARGKCEFAASCVTARRDPTDQVCAMRKQTHSQSVLEISRVLSLAGSLALAGCLGAFIAGEHAAWAKGGGGGGGGGNGNGNGGGNGGSGGSGSGSGSGSASGGIGAGIGIGGTGVGGGVGAGVGVGTGGTGSGTTGGTGSGTTGGTGSGTGTAGASGGSGIAAGGSQGGSAGSSESSATATREQAGFFTRVLRTIGLVSPEPVATPSVMSAPTTLGGPPRTTPPKSADHVSASAPKLREQRQAFRFEAGTAVFPTTGGVFTTERVDGVDVVTVDALHHRVIHPAAFFEPHEGARYDRRAVESFWPIEVGTRVRFLESLGTVRWEHVMSAIRVETVSVPAGVFRAFVVEHTVQPLGQGPQPAATYTYWYSPDAGAIVKSQFRPGDGKPPVTDEADVLGYPLTRPSTASTGVLE